MLSDLILFLHRFHSPPISQPSLKSHKASRKISMLYVFAIKIGVDHLSDENSYVESRRCQPVFIWVPPLGCTGASQNCAPKQKYQTDNKLRRRLIQCTTKYILRHQSLLFCHVHCCGSHQKTMQLINTRPSMGKLSLGILLQKSRKGTERCNRSTNLTLDKTLCSLSIQSVPTTSTRFKQMWQSTAEIYPKIT